MGGFTYAIGDAQGRFDLVCKAISLAEQHCGNGRGTFVCCGDFVDRGPQSRQIIDLFMAGPSLTNWTWRILAGNHEDMMALALRSMRHMNWWVGNGGERTLMSYGATEGMTYDDAVKLVPNAHIEWLQSLPVHYLDDHRAFVHAGFDPDRPLAEQDREYMTWTRDNPSADYSFEGRHVVHGHEQFEHGPILNSQKSNIDTFAWLHGRLAVAVFDDATPGGPVEILWAEGEPA